MSAPRSDPRAREQLRDDVLELMRELLTELLPIVRDERRRRERAANDERLKESLGRQGYRV